MLFTSNSRKNWSALLSVLLCLGLASSGFSAGSKKKKKEVTRKSQTSSSKTHKVQQSGNDQAELSKLLTRVDNLWVGDSSEAKMTMKVKKKEYERELGLKYWVKGRDKTLILITDPPKESGTATLKINDEMYNYLPKTGSTTKVSSALRGGSWMGSHLNNDDLIRSTRLDRDYDGKILSRTPEKSGEIWRVEMIPKKNTATPWGKIEIVINKKTAIPSEQKYFDESKNLVRTIKYSAVKTLSKREVPTKIEVIPAAAPSEYTLLTYVTLDFGAKLDDDMFSTTRIKDLK